MSAPLSTCCPETPFSPLNAVFFSLPCCTKSHPVYAGPTEHLIVCHRAADVRFSLRGLLRPDPWRRRRGGAGGFRLDHLYWDVLLHRRRSQVDFRDDEREHWCKTHPWEGEQQDARARCCSVDVIIECACVSDRLLSAPLAVPLRLPPEVYRQIWAPRASRPSPPAASSPLPAIRGSRSRTSARSSCSRIRRAVLAAARLAQRGRRKLWDATVAPSGGPRRPPLVVPLTTASSAWLAAAAQHGVRWAQREPRGRWGLP